MSEVVTLEEHAIARKSSGPKEEHERRERAWDTDAGLPFDRRPFNG